MSEIGSPEIAPPSQWRRRAQFVLRLAITILLLWLVIRRLDLHAALRVLSSARLDMLALMLVSMLVERVYATYRWYVLLRCGDDSVDFRHLLRINFASAFLGCFMPTAGMDVLRVVGHARRSDDPAMAFSSVLLDRYLGLLALVATALIGLAVEPVAVSRAIQWVAWPLIGLLAVGFVTVVNERSRRAIDHVLANFKFLSIAAKFHKVMARLDTMRNSRGVMLWSLSLAFGIQAVRIMSVFFGARALGIETPLIYLAATVPVIVFIQLLPIAVGGFGAREAAFVYFLGAVGVSAESAFALSLLVYLMTTLSNLPGAWTSFQAFSRARPVPSLQKAKVQP